MTSCSASECRFSPGGATGLLGTAISGVIDFFQARQNHAQEMDLRRLDIDLAKAEAEGAERVAAIEAEGVRDQAEWEAMAASYREAGARWSRPGEGVLMQLVDFTRGMTRPELTFGLVALVGAIYFLLGASDEFVTFDAPAAHCRDRALSRHRLRPLVVRPAPDRKAPRRGRAQVNGELEAWIARGVVSAVVAACVGLFVRTRKLEARAAVAEKTLGNLEKRDPGTAALDQAAPGDVSEDAPLPGHDLHPARWRRCPSARDIRRLGPQRDGARKAGRDSLRHGRPSTAWTR